MITGESGGRGSGAAIDGTFAGFFGLSEGAATLSIRFPGALCTSTLFGAVGIAGRGSAGESRRGSATFSNAGCDATGGAACMGGISSASAKESAACQAALVAGTRATGTAGATEMGGLSAIAVRDAAAITRWR